MRGIRLAVVLAGLALPAVKSAHWRDRPVPGIPPKEGWQTRDGCAGTTTADGKPDLSGVWQPVNDPVVKGTNQEPLSRYFISILFGTKREDEPLQPEAREAFVKRLQLDGKDDPISHCHS